MKETLDALDELLSQNYDWIMRGCFFEIRDAELARDCAQEVMIEIAKSFHRFRGDSAFKTWAFTIFKRVSRRFRKRLLKGNALVQLGKEKDLSEKEIHASEQKSPLSAFEKKEEQRELLEAVGQLPEKQRHAVMLHYFEDLSVKDAASQLGCSEGTLKTHLFRARKKLKGLLTGE